MDLEEKRLLARDEYLSGKASHIPKLAKKYDIDINTLKTWVFKGGATEKPWKQQKEAYLKEHMSDSGNVMRHHLNNIFGQGMEAIDLCMEKLLKSVANGEIQAKELVSVVKGLSESLKSIHPMLRNEDEISAMVSAGIAKEKVISTEEAADIMKEYFGTGENEG